MRKQILLRAAIGFAAGMAMFLAICLLFNRGPDGTVYYCSDTLLARVGSAGAAMTLQLAVCGLYGAACMAGTVFYDVERWSQAKATVAHYLVVAGGYLVPALLLGWELNLATLLVIEGMMTAGFFLIWLIMYLIYRAKVRELNELLQERNEYKRRAARKGKTT